MNLRNTKGGENKMTRAGIDTNLLESKMFLKGFKSRKQFAHAVGTSALTISNLLNGVHNPSYDLINSIYRVLELTPEEGTEIFFNDDLRVAKVCERA